MADPWGVVVVPVAGDPGGLLASGPLGHRVPLVSRWDPDANSYGWQSFRCRNARALPLWWAGALVPEGWDRARRVWWDRSGTHPPSKEARHNADAVADCFNPDADLIVRGLCPALVACGAASRVVLLDLVDGRLVGREGSDGR